LTPERAGRETYLQGAFILAGAAMISRILGAVYRIPLARFISDYGMGLYGAGYQIYQVLLGISTVGINVAISKVMAEKLARDDERGAFRVFGISFLLLAALGLGSALLLGFGAKPLADHWNPDVFFAVVALAPAIFLVALEGSLRGYFQGYQRMTPPAVSQIVEQFFRVSAVLVLAYVLLPRGEAVAAGGAALGATAGAMLGAVYLLFPYVRSRGDVRRRLASQPAPPRRGPVEPAGDVVRRIVTLAVPISIAGVVIPLMGIADLLFVPDRLEAIGFSVVESTKLYGQLSQMAMVLINFPAVVTYGLQTSLVPAISEAQALGDTDGIVRKATSGIRATLLIALPAAVGLWVLASPICGLLYRHPEVGVPLAALSGAVIFLMIQQTTSGVLQGLGRTDLPVRNLIVGAVVKTALVWFLTGVPALNIRGAAYSTVAGFLVAAALNVISVSRLVGLKVDLVSSVLKPLVASAVMGGALYLAFPVLQPALGADVATLTAVGAGGLVYGLVLLLVGAVKERDLALLPGVGSRLARLLKGVGLVRD